MDSRQTQELPRLALISAGGTIDLVGEDRLDLAWYREARRHLEQAEFIGRIPELVSVARVEPISFRRLGMDERASDWLELVRLIHDILHRDAADAIVITHGTNSMEELAFFLTLVLKTKLPVVLTGAMRPASALSSDGYLNLLNAARVAASPDAPGKGVLVVMNDTIYSARDVTKTATYRLQAFQSPDAGPLGYADADGQVVFFHETTRPHTMATEFDVRTLTDLPRVDMVISYFGADERLIDAAVAAGAKGLISAGVGSGRPTLAEEEALDRARMNGVVVCQSSRAGSGRTVRSPSLRRRGIVAGGNLQPWKARVLLSLALTVSSDAERIQQMFDRY